MKLPRLQKQSVSSKKKMRQSLYKKMLNSNNRKRRSRNSQSVTTAMDGTDY